MGQESSSPGCFLFDAAIKKTKIKEEKKEVMFPHAGLEAELPDSTVHSLHCHLASKMRSSGLLLAGVLRKKRRPTMTVS